MDPRGEQHAERGCLRADRTFPRLLHRGQRPAHRRAAALRRHGEPRPQRVPLLPRQRELGAPLHG
jgi:hypothetical protein